MNLLSIEVTNAFVNYYNTNDNGQSYRELVVGFLDSWARDIFEYDYLYQVLMDGNE